MYFTPSSFPISLYNLFYFIKPAWLDITTNLLNLDSMARDRSLHKITLILHHYLNFENIAAIDPGSVYSRLLICIFLNPE